jgi:hypothetical protein
MGSLVEGSRIVENKMDMASNCGDNVIKLVWDSTNTVAVVYGEQSC